MIQVTLPFKGLELVDGTHQYDETEYDFRDWKDTIVYGKVQEIAEEWSGRYLALPVLSDVLIQKQGERIPLKWQEVGSIIFLGEYFADIEDTFSMERKYYRTLVYNIAHGWLQSYLCGHHTVKESILMYK